MINLFYLTGINIDLETDMMQEEHEGFEKVYDDIWEQSAAFLQKLLDYDSVVQEQYKVPSFEIKGKR